MYNVLIWCLLVSRLNLRKCHMSLKDIEGWRYHKQEEEEPGSHCDSQTERQMNKESKESGKQHKVMWTSCRKLSCVIREGWGCEVSGHRDTESDGEDECPGADQRHEDSPRLLFSFKLFSCSFSNRTVNNNNNSGEKRWLTGSPSWASWLVQRCVLIQPLVATVNLVLTREFKWLVYKVQEC